jgi:acetyl esterase/lipase
MLYSLYRFSKNYIHEADYEKPRASPLLYKSFNKVPPALIIMAELDMNRDHGYGRLLFTVVCH